MVFVHSTKDRWVSDRFDQMQTLRLAVQWCWPLRVLLIVWTLEVFFWVSYEMLEASSMSLSINLLESRDVCSLLRYHWIEISKENPSYKPDFFESLACYESKHFRFHWLSKKETTERSHEVVKELFFSPEQSNEMNVKIIASAEKKRFFVGIVNWILRRSFVRWKFVRWSFLNNSLCKVNFK